MKLFTRVWHQKFILRNCCLFKFRILNSFHYLFAFKVATLPMEKSQINFKEIGFRAQSKSEIYRALVTEGSFFLSLIKETSMLFICQLAVGEKKVGLNVSFCINILNAGSQGSTIEVCVLPHVKGLRSKDLIELLINYWNGQQYLPYDYIDYTPNRSWLANLCKSLASDGLNWKLA